MNAPQKIERPTETPWARQCRHANALRDLRAEFEQRWASLLAEYEMRKSRIDRDYYFGASNDG